MTTKTFKSGDKVKVADDAKFIDNGTLIPTRSAGCEAVITHDLNKGGNYTMKLTNTPNPYTTGYSCLPEYLTLISSAPNPCVEVPITESVYCTCGGSGKETGIGMLIFTVCKSCKKEK